MNTDKSITCFKEYLILSFGTLIYCMAWVCFMIPNNIASGGLTGMCTILQFATNGGIPVAYSFIIANVILLIIAFIVLGKGVGFKTIYCILLSTLFFEFLPRFAFLESIPGQPLYISEKVLVPIIGGLMEAVGIGFILHYGGSTGGTDIIALIVNKFWPVSLGKAYFYMDIFIIASILLIPGKTVQDMVYGYIAMITFSLMVDFVLLGRKSTVQVLIFSQKYDRIADYIIEKMDRGVTVLKSVGWYTKQEKDVLLVLVRKTQLSSLTKVVKEIDKNAFVSVSPASSVYGEGFEEIKAGVSKKLSKNIEDTVN
ncbi:MAG: YitT family protein [Candidatus Cryptobacteroides sp.]